MWWTGKESLFQWHSKIGYVILSVVVTRLIWGFVGSHHARFVNFVRGWSATRAYIKAPANTVGHNPLGALSVLALLGVLLVQGFSGLFSTDDIASEGPLAYLVGDLSYTMTALHGYSWTVLQGLILLHIAAVLFYQWSRKYPLLQAMLRGSAEGKISEFPPVSLLRWIALLVLVIAVLVGLLWLAPSAPAYY